MPLREALERYRQAFGQTDVDGNGDDSLEIFHWYLFVKVEISR